MNNAKASVVIPVFNAQKTLKTCLDSLAGQNYPEYEVIVVDNNSSDHSTDLIQAFAQKNTNFKYALEKKRGRGAARRKGETLAKGDIILMTDADCIVPENWISQMSNPIQKGQTQAIQGGELPALNNFWTHHFQNLADTKKLTPENLIGAIDTKNFAINRKTLQKIGFTSKKYVSGNDTDLSIRLQKNKIKTLFFRDIKVKHFHPESLFQSVKKQFHRAYWCKKITIDHKDYLKKTSFPSATNQTFWGFIKIFPGLLRTLILKGPGKMFFDLVTGLAWRAGLLSGWLFVKKQQPPISRLRSPTSD